MLKCSKPLLLPLNEMKTWNNPGNLEALLYIIPEK